MKCRKMIWTGLNNSAPQEIEERKGEILVHEPRVLERVENRIYFYSEIDRDKVLELNKELRETDNSHIRDKIVLKTNKLVPIYLHINSYGGYISDGLSAMDNILMCNSPVYTIVDGIAASAATFLTIVGTKRYMTKNSVMLIHQLSGANWGNYEQLKDDMKNADLYMMMIKKLYKQYTKVPESKLDEILKHDLFFDSDQCIQYGLVDEIIKN